MARCNTLQLRSYVEKDCATWSPEERERWIDEFVHFDEFDGPRWVRSTQYNVANAYTNYLRCVRRKGLPGALTSEGVKAFIEDCEARQDVPRTIAGFLWKLWAIADILHSDRHLEFRWLLKTCCKVEGVARDTPKGKNEWILTADVLFNLGETLINEARALGPESGWKAIQLYRDGLILCFGVEVPERLRALQSITVGDVRDASQTIKFDAKRIKTKKESIRTYSERTAEYLMEWIERFRVRYTPNHDFLWIAKGGKPACPEALSIAMKKITSKRLGIPATPHRLRDAAATLIVSRIPERATLATTILGHKSERMTRNYTETADQIEASREATQLISSAKEKLRREVRVDSRSEIALNPRRRRRRRKKPKLG